MSAMVGITAIESCNSKDDKRSLISAANSDFQTENTSFLFQILAVFEMFFTLIIRKM